MNTNELIWNFNVSQRLLPKRNLILSLRAVDLLNQRDEVNRNVRATARTDSRTQNIHSYFLVSATYRFGKFGGKGKRSQNGEGNERGGEVNVQQAALEAVSVAQAQEVQAAGHSDEAVFLGLKGL